jgi:hypothetical protein
VKVEYPNEVQRFYYEELGWCGCGSPDEVLGFIRDVLQAMNDWTQANRRDDEAAREAAQARQDALLPRAGGMLVLSYLYMLGAHGLTEHGGSVYGSWITDEGERVLAMLSGIDLEKAMDEGAMDF